MKVAAIILSFFVIFYWFSVVCCQQNDNIPIDPLSGVSSEERLKELLACPSCLELYDPDERSYEMEEVSIPSGDIELAGILYYPKNEEQYPVIIFMHGGGNDYEMLMSSVKYYAPRMAHCGFAALIYDKRGTGESGGVFHESTYDDYIADAGHAAEFLKEYDRVDPDRIGVYGGSQGGRLAPVVAVRYPCVSFAISVSGPIGTLADHATFNMEYALKTRGYEDTTIEKVMPLWRKHHAAWESFNPDEFDEVAAEIMKYRGFYDTFALPNTRDEFDTDSNLFFLRPPYFSMSNDYISELVKLDVPWLVLYGELDPIINARESIDNIHKQMKVAENSNYEVIVIEEVGHSFNNSKTGDHVPIENIVVNWLNEIISK